MKHKDQPPRLPTFHRQPCHLLCHHLLRSHGLSWARKRGDGVVVSSVPALSTLHDKRDTTPDPRSVFVYKLVCATAVRSGLSVQIFHDHQTEHPHTQSAPSEPAVRRPTSTAPPLAMPANPSTCTIPSVRQLLVRHKLYPDG